MIAYGEVFPDDAGVGIVDMEAVVVILDGRVALDEEIVPVQVSPISLIETNFEQRLIVCFSKC